MNLLSKARSLLEQFSPYLQSPLLLVIRLYWGWQFFLTGKGKLMNLDRTTSYFASLNLPAPHLNAIMDSSFECVGGLLLIFGLFSRFVGATLSFMMCVAYVTAEREAVTMIFSNPDKFLGADPFLFLYASVIVLAFGPGRLSLDSLFFRKAKA